MKVAQITEPYHVELVDLPTPQAQGDQVVVKILSAPMCAEHKIFKAARCPAAPGKVGKSSSIPGRSEVRIY